jgi:hypothetical protein
MRHHITEEGAFWDADLASPDTLAALLLRLGNCRQADQIIEVKDTVIDWLRRCTALGAAASIRRARGSDRRDGGWCGT